MKKLLVLMLVLGMNSAASATLTVVQPSPPALHVEIGNVLEGDMILVISSDGELSGYTVCPCLNISYKLGDTEDFGGLGCPAGFTGEVWVLAASDDPYPFYGVVMTVDGGAVGDYVAIGWFDENMNSGIIDVIQLVPEPMTLALLGLGSLFVLRRRK